MRDYFCENFIKGRDVNDVSCLQATPRLKRKQKMRKKGDDRVKVAVRVRPFISFNVFLPHSVQ